MEPNQSGEVFWMLLSLLCLPVKDQIEIMGGLPSVEGDPLFHDFVNNPASQLISTMYQYYNGWWDEFEPNVQNAEKIFSMLNGSAEFGFSADSFCNDSAWKELRALAKAALNEAGMDLWPVPEKIDFNDYIEIVQPETKNHDGET